MRNCTRVRGARGWRGIWRTMRPMMPELVLRKLGSDIAGTATAECPLSPQQRASMRVWRQVR